MKGILLAGGLGTRLYPATRPISKQLLPVYDKPMIYYPLTTLMLAGLREILIITTPAEAHLFQNLLGDGTQWGIQLSYATQAKPNGIAEAFIIAEEFIGHDSVCLMLGDNILYGDSLPTHLHAATNLQEGGVIFSYYVSNPTRYGVICFDQQDRVTDIIEKPATPISHYASIGLYFYDNRVIEIAKQLKPSPRGELEITDISRHYLQQQQLRVEKMGRGIAWLDTGTPSSLLDAAHFVRVLEERQGLKIGCPEEAAWRMHWISDTQLTTLANRQGTNDYAQYLLNLMER